MSEPLTLCWRADNARALQAQLGLETLPVEQVALLDKKARERWLMAVWLGVCANGLSYPLRVHASERPDFLLDSPGRQGGVECMEVVPEELKRLQTELREVNSGWIRPLLAPGQHDWDWSNPLLQRLLNSAGRKGLFEPGDPPSLWLAVMGWAVAKKRKVFAREGYQRRVSNGLLLHDNWPLPVLRDMPVRELHRQLLEQAAFADFQQVAIVQAATVWLLQAEGVREMPRG